METALPDRTNDRAADQDNCHAVLRPGRLEAPIVLASPHSGRNYPASFLGQSRLDPLALRRSEDAFVDDLFAPCVAHGAPLIRALFPRAYVDVNREPFELDPHMFSDRLPSYANTRSLRVAGGLGTIPRLVGDAQPIYRDCLTCAEALNRIDTCYRPFHAELTRLVETAVAVFGICVLVDCHSMPSSAVENGQSDMVIGDRFGASAASWVTDCLIGELQALGYVVRRNKPYAGGFITEHYGAPGSGRHSVQIEVNRALYMDERRIEKLPAMTTLQDNLFKVIGVLNENIAARRKRPILAAE